MIVVRYNFDSLLVKCYFNLFEIFWDFVEIFYFFLIILVDIILFDGFVFLYVYGFRELL